MPLMKMTHRTSPVWVTTTIGYSYLFRPNEPVMVHPQCVKVCQEKGAAFVNEKDNVPEPGNVETRKKRLPTAGEVHDMLVKACNDLADNAATNRENFTAGGRPKVSWASDKLGFDVNSDQVNRAWTVVLKTRMGRRTVQAE